MKNKPLIHTMLLIVMAITFYSCEKNHPPVIAQILLSEDTVFTNQQVEIEVIITDTDNDVTHCFWFFNNERDSKFDYRTKVLYTAPNTPGLVEIMVVADDGKTEVSAVNTLLVE